MNESEIAFIGICVIAGIIFGPLISIWALNTLFGLSIPFTFATWFASLWISGIIAGGAKMAVNNKS